MILVDTSVWIDHLRAHDTVLADLLGQGQVASHPFVIGELALGNLRQRARILVDLQSLPQTAVATGAEILRFIEVHSLAGLGIGYVDAHLLAGALLTPGTSLWTRDKGLRAAAERLGLAALRLR